MATGAWIGISGKARKVKSMYVGIGGKARKVKAAWVGIGGKARKIYSSEDELRRTNAGLEYPGRARCYSAGSSVGNFIVFIHGGYGPSATSSWSSTNTSDIDYINKSTLTASKMTYGGSDHLGSSASNSNFAFYAGGISSGMTSMKSAVFKIDSSMTASSCSSLDYSCYAPHSASSDDHAIFMGGGYGQYAGDYYVRSQSVSYDKSGTKISLDGLSARSYHGYIGCMQANYGCTISGNIGLMSSVATLFNSITLTKTVISGVGVSENWQPGGTNSGGRQVLSINNEILIGPTYSKSAKSLNKSFTVSDYAWELPRGAAASSIGNIGVYFGGAGNASYGVSSTVTQINTSLTRKNVTGMSSERSRVLSSALDDTCIVLGGMNGSYHSGEDSDSTQLYYSGTFDVYKV